jgi:phage-related protein
MWFTNMLTFSMRTVRFYRTSAGRCPVEEFLDSLFDQHAKKVAWVLRLVERLDIVPQQYFKKLTGTEHLWEIRAQAGGNSYRLLGFFDGSALLVLASGFSKKQEKTPAREIELAESRRKDYLSRRS